MAINTPKVIAGGIASGVVLAIVDTVMSMFVLKDRMTAEANAFKAGLGDQMMAGSAPIAYIVIDIIIGIALVWTYAAIRPRFGSGARTAVYAALLVWVLGCVFQYGYLQMGMMSSGLWLTYAAIWLVAVIAASWVGGRIYTEDTAPVTP